MTRSSTSFEVVLPLALQMMFAAPVCEEWKTAGVEKIVRYLQVDRSSLKPDCIAYGLDEIGRKRYSAGADVAVSYLDFRRPSSLPQPGQQAVKGRLPGVGDWYPAAGALIAIGKPALPAIARGLAGVAMPEAARKVALRVLPLIYEDGGNDGDSAMLSAIRFLAVASRATDDPNAGERLRSAARQVAEGCSADLRTRCYDAVAGFR